jgi:YlmC/YmxH family sporulation protein
MIVRIAELRDRQVICVKNGALLGMVGDIELDTESGKLSSIVIFGRPKGFGLFGRDDDIVIPWEDIEIIGNETILVKTC